MVLDLDATDIPLYGHQPGRFFHGYIEMYLEMLEHGLPFLAHIAVPVKGNYFLRLGVHDVNGGAVGALELPVDQVKPDVAGPGFAAAAIRGSH